MESKIIALQQTTQVDLEQPEEQLEQHNKRAQQTPREHLVEHRRQCTLVKPAKYYIPEFDALGTYSWIQQIEMYFDPTRILANQRLRSQSHACKGLQFNDGEALV